MIPWRRGWQARKAWPCRRKLPLDVLYLQHSLRTWRAWLESKENLKCEYQNESPWPGERKAYASAASGFFCELRCRCGCPAECIRGRLPGTELTLASFTGRFRLLRAVLSPKKAEHFCGSCFRGTVCLASLERRGPKLSKLHPRIKCPLWGKKIL